jgi:hypothetical protein
MNLKSLVFIFVLIGASFAVIAQPINIYRTFGGVRFERDTLNLTLRQVSDIISVNPVASAEFKTAKFHYHAAGVMGFSGAVLLLLPAITSITGGEPEWVLAGAGAALVLGSIPLTVSFRNKAMKAIDTYNSTLPSGKKRVQFFWAGASAGIRF